MSKKSASPLIATVLLIGFAFSLGVIFMTWFSESFKSHSSEISEKGEREIKCTFASFKAPKFLVSYNFSVTPPHVNLTVINTGSEKLYNFSFTVITKRGEAVLSYIFVPLEQKTEKNPLEAGRSWVVTIIPQSYSPSSEETVKEIQISALCQKEFAVQYRVVLEE